jgi:ATP-binding cassette subfamily B protein
VPGDRQPLHNLWRTRDYLRPYRWTYVALVGAGLGATGLAVMIPLIVERVIDGPVLHQDPSGLWQLGALALAFGMLEAGLSFFRRWASSSSSLGMESRIRSDLYRHLQRLPVGFHDGWQSGQLLSRATSDLSAIRRFLTFGLIFLVINTVTYVTVVSLLINMYWPLGLLVAASTVVLWRISHRFTRQYNVVSRRVQDQVGDVASLAEESAGGIRVIKAFRRHDHMESQFEHRARTLRDTAVRKIRLQATTWPRFDLVTNTMLASSLLGGAVAVSVGHLTVGQLVAFVTLQLMLIWPVDSLGHIIANAQEAMTAADRIYELLDERPSILDQPRATVLHRESVHAHVRFEGVEFAYPGAEEPILRGVDLEVFPGETLAIVGVTGSGKTTLAHLVPRLADPTAGRITLDGVDIRDVTLESLRSVVGFAFEEATLFSMSVR